MFHITHRYTAAITAAAFLPLGAGAVALATTSGHVAQSHHAMRLVPTASVAAAAATGTTVREFETDVTIQPGADDGSFGRCPRSAPHAISGYWGTDDLARTADVVVVRSTPVGRGGRSWEVGLKNTGATPVTAYVGMVCVK